MNCVSRIIEIMARGWESKSVEEQQALAHADSPSYTDHLSKEQAKRLREGQGLRLSRQHILQQVQVSQNPRHLQMLEAALADLEARLRELEGEDQSKPEHP